MTQKLQCLYTIGTCETTYLVDLIEKILHIKGPVYLCDERMRGESPEYVEKHYHYDVFGYVDKKWRKY